MEIYLDNAATEKPNTNAVQSMLRYLLNDEDFHNPSALYRPATKIHEMIQNIRLNILDELSAVDKDDEIIFTSGGSESNCMAILGFVNACQARNERCIILYSEIEHKSITAMCDDLESIYDGVDCYLLKVDNEGFYDIEDILSKIKFWHESNCKVLLSLQYANNEIGTIQPIKDIVQQVRNQDTKIYKRTGINNHTTVFVDAVQAFPEISIDVNYLDIDMLSVSGHKFGTPKGIGFLYKNKSTEIKPIIYGSQNNGLRGGTENVPYIVNMDTAIKDMRGIHNRTRIKNIRVLRDYLIELLEKLGCRLVGTRESRLANNINVILPKGVTGEGMIYILDNSNIRISAGSACNSNKIGHSSVLKAIGIPDEENQRAIRISLAPDTTRKEIETLVKELKKGIKLFAVKVETEEVEKI